MIDEESRWSARSVIDCHAGCIWLPTFSRRRNLMGAMRSFALGCFTISIFLGSALPGAAEESASTDPWEPVRFLSGRWKGSIDGRLGTGTGERHYEFVLGGRFLLMNHSSVRLPQEKSPAGDHHEEIGIFSVDGERNKLILRTFNIEGFTLQYVCDVETGRLVCVTEQVENGRGIRARVTLTKQSRHSFEEVFEIAWREGEDLCVYFTNTWTRAPDLG
ncbi:MAG: hypothetical protein O7A04_03125 [Acidobacteria bacterium]|nr:hypothetical protein [Acidobacteriota bacterium]